MDSTAWQQQLVAFMLSQNSSEMAHCRLHQNGLTLASAHLQELASLVAVPYVMALASAWKALSWLTAAATLCLVGTVLLCCWPHMAMDTAGMRACMCMWLDSK